MLALIIALFLIEALVLSSLVYTDHGLWGLTSIVVTLILYWALGGSTTLLGIWYAILDKPINSIAIVVGYLIIGVAWSFFKYYSHVRAKKRSGYSKASLANSDNTSLVLTWMAYWPVSIVLHIIGDGIYKLYLWIYDQVKGVYTWILDKVYKE